MAKEKEIPNYNTFSDIIAAESIIPIMFPAERETNGSLRVLSLFSGCGGMDLGFCI